MSRPPWIPASIMERDDLRLLFSEVRTYQAIVDREEETFDKVTELDRADLLRSSTLTLSTALQGYAARLSVLGDALSELADQQGRY